MSSEHSNKDAAIDFLILVVSGDVREAFRKHVGPGFRHHNPYFPGDANTLMVAMEENAVNSPNKVFEIQCTLQDDDMVAVFSRIRQKPEDSGATVVHIFRFQGNLIVELWDVVQEVPENSINENGMF